MRSVFQRRQPAVAAIFAMGIALATPSAWAISAGCSAIAGGSLNGTTQTISYTGAFDAGDTITITNSSSDYSYTSLRRGGSQVAYTGTGVTTLTFTQPSAGTFTFEIYSGVTSAMATFSVSATCVGGTASSTTTSSIATNAKQSTQFVAPKVMATATTAIGTLIGNNVKGAFSRVGGGLDGRGPTTALAANAPAEVILAEATGQGPRTHADTPSGLKQGLLDGKLGGFAEMSYSHLRSREAGGEYVGDVKNGVAGLDYKIQPNILLGVAVGYEMTDFTTIYNRGWLDGKGVTIAPYMGIAFSNFVLDVTVGRSWLDYDNLRGTSNNAYGSYTADREFVTSNLTATYFWQGLRLAPSAGLLFAREIADAYIDSRGQRQDEVASKMGRASLGGEIGRALDLGDICVCRVEPFVKARLNHDFIHAGRSVLANGQLSAVNDLTGQIGGGVRLGFGRYLAAVIDGSYDTIGAADLEGWNVRGRIDFTLPF